jgi:uncharacterized protein YjbJ (UPF0337 family)
MRRAAGNPRRSRPFYIREWQAPAIGAPTGSRNSDMGELTDKIKGNVNEAIGKAKQQSDNPAKRDEGAGQELKGKSQQFIGKVKGALGDDI